MDKKTVLLVEDSMTDAFAANDILYGHCKVVHITHANHILDEARRVRPDLVLMDIVMPGVSGFHAIRLLKSHEDTRGIPVVVCSGKEMATDKVWAGRCGANAYLVKPVNKTSLLGVVRALLGGS